MRREPGKKSADWVPGGCSRCPWVCPTPFHGQIRLERGLESGCGSAGIAGTIELSC